MTSLKDYNTFQVDTTCKNFISITSVEQLQTLCSQPNEQVVILGGGSNSLFVHPIDVLWYIDIKGISLIKEREEYVLIRANAGEDWHEFVSYCVEHNYGGVENLALIPGKVGAAPIQNIGAYGVEIKDVIQSVSVVDRYTGTISELHASKCNFGYRNSLFKQEQKGRYIVDSIVVRLSKAGYHRLNTSYGAINQHLSSDKEQTIMDVYDAVIAIRSAKLPDPKKIGNGGSFFKNPIISKDQFDRLQTQYHDMPHYLADNQKIKLPAGWLIDQAGWKGKKVGNVGCYKNQALVIVNHGGASGTEILKFSEAVQASVLDRFDIELEREVNVV